LPSGVDFLLFVFIHFFDSRILLALPVVRVVVAGGLALGREVCAGDVVAGRVTVTLGGGFAWAAAS
jgi:hypothetical protein